MDAELWIVGEGEERKRLARVIEESSLQDRVKLLGFQDDTVALYQSMDVFALSSSREGLPKALNEAKKLELPVVATRVAGVPLLIRDQINGLLIEPGSVEALADGLERLIRKQKPRHQLGREARATIEESYSFDQRMGVVRRIYDRALNNAKTG